MSEKDETIVGGERDIRQRRGIIVLRKERSVAKKWKEEEEGFLKREEGDERGNDTET